MNTLQTKQKEEKECLSSSSNVDAHVSDMPVGLALVDRPSDSSLPDSFRIVGCSDLNIYMYLALHLMWAPF